MTMSVVGWTVLGLIVGYVASMFTSERGEGAPLAVLLGIGGAVLGGLIFSATSDAGMRVFNIWSMPVAIGSAAVVLFLWHFARRSLGRA